MEEEKAEHELTPNQEEQPIPENEEEAGKTHNTSNLQRLTNHIIAISESEDKGGREH